MGMRVAGIFISSCTIYRHDFNKAMPASLVPGYAFPNTPRYSLMSATFLDFHSASV